jgi:hypothetical protein
MRNSNYVYCENNRCMKKFLLTSPGDLMEMRVIDLHGNEVAPRRDGFICPTCQKLYAEVSHEEEEGSEWL